MAWNSERMQNKVKHMDVKVSRNCFIPKENVKFYVAYEQRCVVNDVKNKKKEGRVYDYTGGKRTASVIYLTSGELVLTTVSLETLNQRMNREGKGTLAVQRFDGL